MSITLRKYLLMFCMTLFFQVGMAQKNVLDSIVKNNYNDTLIYDEEVVTDEDLDADTSAPSVRENIINDTFVWKRLNDSAVTALKNSKDFRYANDSTYWKKIIQKEQETSNDGWFSGNAPKWLSQLGVVLIILVLLFVVYKLVINNSLFEFGSKKPIEQPEIDLSEEGLHLENIDERLTKAESEKNYILYLRLSYIKTLFLLNEAGALNYDKQTTNMQYVFKMRNHRLYNEFRKLAYLNDYIAYGGFEINETQFVKFKDEFSLFQSKLNL